MTTLYRIYTENKNRSTIEDLASQQFAGFTILEARGFWNGVGEPSLVLEILAGEYDYDLVKALAREIKAANAQESVLITVARVHGDLV